MASTDPLQPWITAYHRQKIGMAADPNFADFKTAFATNPALLAQASDELAAMVALNGSLMGRLKERDYAQYLRAEALKGMLAQYQGAPT